MAPRNDGGKKREILQDSSLSLQITLHHPNCCAPESTLSPFWPSQDEERPAHDLAQNKAQENEQAEDQYKQNRGDTNCLEH